MTADPLSGRTGARRRSEIPAAVLHALEAGRTETVCLVEWLAVDMAVLLDAVLRDVRVEAGRDVLVEAARSRSGVGVMQRVRGVGDDLRSALDDDRLRALAVHGSDIARQWACYALAGGADASLSERLESVRPFAADHNMSVREIAWWSLRDAVLADVPAALALLSPWVRDADENIRRFAVEGTRPRGVWCPHCPELKADPTPGFALLEPVRSDPALYVRNAVANWLNDARKTRPELVIALCRRWTDESPTPETATIVRRALRTLRKRGADAVNEPGASPRRAP